ncbi:MAG TPA: aminotransferase class V-fold PLP-dependent enzyme [Vicinamibacterales bacterium]|nr:aminotransferase class V-fold PLP-dependent enzyme [Vicinamibacterales bacterium]
MEKTPVPLLDLAARYGKEYLELVAKRPVRAELSADELRSRLAVPLTQPGEPPETVLERLAGAGRRGTIASQGPRYFGFVVGGSLPVATAADWLASAWDQNCGIFALSPVVSVVEDVAASWLRDLAGLPGSWSVGFVTGCQMANFTALAAARQHLLAKAGWDVNAHGLFGAPTIQVFVSDESHYTIFAALRMLGMGAERLQRIPTDDQGRMRAQPLIAALRSANGPCLVCAQAGNVNTGAFDPITDIVEATRERDAWLHVDGAFGLWAAASPQRRSLVAGVDRADSVATDAHKWLNVPYDCGVMFCAHPDAHRRAMSMSAAYILESAAERDPRDFVPEESRRARAVPVYAALATLGRDGLADLVERTCRLAARMASRLSTHQSLRILNDVVLNQVLVRIEGADPDALTRDMIVRLQQDGTCWAGGTTWHGMAALRISISNWSTTEVDIDRSADAIVAATDAAIGQLQT